MSPGEFQDLAAAEFAAASNAAPLYLVTFRDDVTDVRAVANEMARTHGLALPSVRDFAARGFTAAIPDVRVAAVRCDPRVLIFEKDGPVSLIKPIEVPGAPSTRAGGTQQTPWGITRVNGGVSGAGRTVWIIDTGIDFDHPDLNTSRNCHA